MLQLALTSSPPVLKLCFLMLKALHRLRTKLFCLLLFFRLQGSETRNIWLNILNPTQNNITKQQQAVYWANWKLLQDGLLALIMFSNLERLLWCSGVGISEIPKSGCNSQIYLGCQLAIQQQKEATNWTTLEYFHFPIIVKVNPTMGIAHWARTNL